MLCFLISWRKRGKLVYLCSENGSAFITSVKLTDTTTMGSQSWWKYGRLEGECHLDSVSSNIQTFHPLHKSEWESDQISGLAMIHGLEVTQTLNNAVFSWVRDEVCEVRLSKSTQRSHLHNRQKSKETLFWFRIGSNCPCEWIHENVKIT